MVSSSDLTDNRRRQDAEDGAPPDPSGEHEHCHTPALTGSDQGVMFPQAAPADPKLSVVHSALD